MSDENTTSFDTENEGPKSDRDLATELVDKCLQLAFDLLDAGHPGEAMHLYTTALSVIEVQEDDGGPWLNLGDDPALEDLTDLETQIRESYASAQLTIEFLNETWDVRIRRDGPPPSIHGAGDGGAGGGPGAGR